MTKQSSLPISLLLTLALLIVATLSQAQNEQKGFSFQGYARDFDGAAFSSQTITARFSIYPDGQSVEYTEDQTLETDAFGVFQAIIGSERPGDFATVDFSSAKYFVTVEVKAVGGDFMEIADTELQAVPYAKAAEKAVRANSAASADNGTPPGVILPFGGPVGKVPVGYLPCDGSEVTVADHPELYEAIGDLWGGDGGTNFNVPDLRGQFLRGQDQGANEDPDVAARKDISGTIVGDKVGSYQDFQLQSHNHTYSRTIVEIDAGIRIYFNNNDGRYYNEVTSSTGGNETRPENAYVLYIIKY